MAQGPTAAESYLAAYVLGLAMAGELVDVHGGPINRVCIMSRFHRGPACPGGHIRLTIEELRPAPGGHA